MLDDVHAGLVDGEHQLLPDAIRAAHGAQHAVHMDPQGLQVGRPSLEHVVVAGVPGPLDDQQRDVVAALALAVGDGLHQPLEPLARRQPAVAAQQPAQARNPQLAPVRTEGLGDPVGEQVEPPSRQRHPLLGKAEVGQHADGRGHRGQLLRRTVRRQQHGGLVAGVGEDHLVGGGVVDARHQGDEHAAGHRLAHLPVDPSEQLSRRVGALAQAVEQARGLGHEQRGVHALARDVAQGEGQTAVGQPVVVVEVPGDLAGRQIDAHDGAAVAVLAGQEVGLDLAGQLQLLADALLLHQLGRHAGIADHQGRGGGEHLEQVLVAGLEQAVAEVLVQHLHHPEALALEQQRGAQHRTGLEAGGGVHEVGEVVVLAHVADELDLAGGGAAADDALVRLEPQPHHVHRTGARLADQLAAAFLQEKQRGGLRVHVAGDLGHRMVQGLVQVQGGGEGLAHVGEQPEGVLAAAPQVAGEGLQLGRALLVHRPLSPAA